MQGFTPFHLQLESFLCLWFLRFGPAWLPTCVLLNIFILRPLYWDTWRPVPNLWMKFYFSCIYLFDNISELKFSTTPWEQIKLWAIKRLLQLFICFRSSVSLVLSKTKVIKSTSESEERAVNQFLIHFSKTIICKTRFFI